MVILLDVILFLAITGSIYGTWAMRHPTGPEGPVGVWILLLIPCLFVAVLLIAFVVNGSLDFLPDGGLFQFAAAVGILITFCTFLLVSPDIDAGKIEALLLSVPYLVLVGCAAVIHQSVFPNPRIGYWAAGILLGGSALIGWGLAGTGVFLYMKADMQRSALRLQQEKEQVDERVQWQLEEYAKLDESVSLYALLQFIWTRNDELQRKVLERIKALPDRDDKLIELIDKDCKEAISYVAKFYDHPPGTLAPAWGKLLLRQLKKYDSLQYDENAGTYEYNLKDFFVGAKQLQLAGGTLHDELLLWHKHLQKCKGLRSLATEVKYLLEMKSKS